MAQSAGDCSNRASHAPVGNRCHVFHLGLPHREVLVLESLFRLNPDLLQRYAFAPCSDEAPAGILFVNGDDPAAMAEWHATLARHPDTVAVFVGRSQLPPNTDAVVMDKLSFRHLEELRYVLRLVTPAAAIHPEDEGIRVLVVDDSATAREMLQACLAAAATNGASMPLHVDFASSGEEALARASERHYDLVFLDVVMPGVDGFEVCRQLKQSRQPRIAMLTGQRTAADYARGHEAGCDHYLAKPVPADMVNTVVRLTSLKKALPTH